MMALAISDKATAGPAALQLFGPQIKAPDTTQPIYFALARTGDSDYDILVRYHTADETAFAGVDYLAAAGKASLGADLAGTFIPVTIEAASSDGPDKAFELIIDSAVGVASQPTFSAQALFGTGTNPNSVIVVDINADGKPDIITANANDNTVSVLLNNTPPGATTPTFAAQQVFAVGSEPWAVAAIDINGDGLPDLVSANEFDNTISVLINTTPRGSATASFQSQQVFATGSDPVSIAIADLNADGKPDIAVANFASGNISVLINSTQLGAMSASLLPQKTFSTGTNPLSVVAGDINSDGMSDLVVANYGVDSISVLPNVSTPGSTDVNFSAAQSFASGSHPRAVAVGDVNGDGKPDIAVANSGDSDVSVFVNSTAAGDATINLVGQKTFATDQSPSSVVFSDVNGDGKPDLLVANAVSTVSVLRNETSPGTLVADFSDRLTLIASGTPAAIASADLNGDGRIDVVAANYNDINVSVFLNAASSAVANAVLDQPNVIPAGSSAFEVGVADLNLDGKPDLIVGNYGSNAVTVLLNQTTAGDSATTFADGQSFATGSYPYHVIPVDVNGDGKIDLVSGNKSDGTVSILLNTTPPGAATLSFAPQAIFQASNNVFAMTTADINGDGKPDLIVTDDTADTVSVLLNTTSPGDTVPSFSAPQSFPAGVIPYDVIAVDINGDGKPDIVEVDLDQDTVSIFVNTTPIGASLPSFAPKMTYTLSGANPIFVTAADLNGDGKQDLVVANYGGSVAVLLNTTPIGASAPSFSSWDFPLGNGGGLTSVAVADIDGDGKQDILAVFVDGPAFALFNYTSPGSSTAFFSPQQTSIVGNGSVWATAADLNGDGRPDFVVSSEVATLSILLNSQYRISLTGSPATADIVHDQIFANGFE